MRPPPGATPDPSNTGRPADIRVSKRQRHNLAHALVTLNQASGVYMTHREARQVVQEHVRRCETVEELEAYLRFTFSMDPTGVTAVRNVTREAAAR